MTTTDTLPLSEAKFLTPTEHGKYWHDLAQERIARVAQLEREIEKLKADLADYQKRSGEELNIFGETISDLRNQRDAALAKVAEMEHQWMFGVSALDICAARAKQMENDELPLDAIRRWIRERDVALAKFELARSALLDITNNGRSTEHAIARAALKALEAK